MRISPEDAKDATGSTPKDFPLPGGPHRVYVAVTNHCNRACPWCSTCSSPAGNTWLAMDDYLCSFPKEGLFEVHLEGGEPTLHPMFTEFVRLAEGDPRCRRVWICTNGAALPRQEDKLGRWLGRFGEKTGVKLSVNHHLLEHDPALIELAQNLVRAAQEQKKAVFFNVRLRKGAENDDNEVVEAMRRAGLLPMANVFFLRRYGLAGSMAEWDPPILVGDNFRMVNPDGRIFGPELSARSEAMRRLA